MSWWLLPVDTSWSLLSVPLENTAKNRSSYCCHLLPIIGNACWSKLACFCLVSSFLLKVFTSISRFSIFTWGQNQPGLARQGMPTDGAGTLDTPSKNDRNMQKLFQHVSTTRINAGQGKDLSIPISQKPWITMDIQPQKKCAWNTHEYPIVPPPFLETIAKQMRNHNIFLNSSGQTYLGTSIIIKTSMKTYNVQSLTSCICRLLWYWFGYWNILRYNDMKNKYIMITNKTTT